MIDYLTISYAVDGINVTFSADVYDGDPCCVLADLFTRVIKDININEDKVIEQLKDNFGL